jgi:DNA polymerase III delta subunit
MSLYILHGENNQASRQKLYEIKESFGAELVSGVLLEKGLPFDNQMFASPEAVILEFFEKEHLRKLNLKKFLDSLRDSGGTRTVILWFGFELTGSSSVLSECLKSGFTELKFAISPLVFKLVDLFFAPKIPNNRFYKLVSDFSVEKGDGVFLVQMLIRSTRLKLWGSFKNNSFLGLSSFSKKQAAYLDGLTTKKLLGIFEELINLERKIKTGSVDLVSNILLLYEVV